MSSTNQNTLDDVSFPTEDTASSRVIIVVMVGTRLILRLSERDQYDTILFVVAWDETGCVGKRQNDISTGTCRNIDITIHRRRRPTPTNQQRQNV